MELLRFVGLFAESFNIEDVIISTFQREWGTSRKICHWHHCQDLQTGDSDSVINAMWYVKHKVGKKTTLKILGILTTFGLCYNEKPITMWGSLCWQRVVIWQIEIGLTLTTGDQWPGLLKSRNSQDKVTGVSGIGGGHLWVDKTHPGALDMSLYAHTHWPQGHTLTTHDLYLSLSCICLSISICLCFFWLFSLDWKYWLICQICCSN